MIRPVFIISALLCLAGSACVKDDKIEPQPASPASVQFNFKARVKNEVLVPETRIYLNAQQDSFTVTKFNYYISNVKLIRADGVVFAEPEGYHLIKHVEGKTSFVVNNVPPGNYTRIEFLIGVDSLRNVSGARQGDLDPANDMFWDWAQGYIFFKMEGWFSTYKPNFGEYGLHIGGFSGPNSCLQRCGFDLLTPVTATGGKQSAVYYNTQIDEIFVKPRYIGFDTYYDNISTGMFRQISENYKDMFVIDRVEN